MIALREIVTRDIFKNFEVPKEFGDEFEMILVPTIDLQNSVTSKNMINEDKWAKFGDWYPDAESMSLCSSSMLKKLDDELGSEDYLQWQK